MTPEKLRANDIAQLKGASMWLTSLPLKREGFAMNKRYFFDALALRYRWTLKYTPTHCHCGQLFSMDHAMQCMLGGYVHRRHDRIRDLFAKLLDEVAYGVEGGGVDVAEGVGLVGWRLLLLLATGTAAAAAAGLLGVVLDGQEGLTAVISALRNRLSCLKISI